jgi:hypothetical protein
VVVLVRKEQMADGSPRHRGKRKSLITFIDKELQNKKINDLSTDGINLLNLLTLIVDIEYRNRYGSLPDWQQGKGYKVSVNEVPADKLPPVDDKGSAGLSSAGGSLL